MFVISSSAIINEIALGVTGLFGWLRQNLNFVLDGTPSEDIRPPVLEDIPVEELPWFESVVSATGPIDPIFEPVVSASAPAC